MAGTLFGWPLTGRKVTPSMALCRPSQIMYSFSSCEQPSETSEPAITSSSLKWQGKYQWSRSRLFSPMSRPRPCAPPRGIRCVTRSIISILRAHSLCSTPLAEAPSTEAHVPGLCPAQLRFCMSVSEKLVLVHGASMYGATSFWLAK